MKNNVYDNEFIPSIIKYGRITLFLGMLLALGPALILALHFGYMPPIGAIIAGTLAQMSVSGAFYVVEPISYFPILGIPGTYMAFLSGNLVNMRIPCAVAAQEAAGVKQGTNEGAIISTLGIAVSILINIAILSIAVFLGSSVLASLPAEVTRVLNLILPALFGAVFGQFAIQRPKLGVVAITIAGFMTFLLKQGFLSFLPGTPSYAVILVSVFGTIAAGKKIYGKELQGE
ncbi:hypothetical protein KQI42_11830 [Tissierella sp. MSJ-40]|uniref:Uncharacterized protein n=1 Tax=Tissierella simiarum TaxID=2841534 RepID=A0ABS6E713_9FIRM|nr:hypothetical protein [Tissierella simiarum]MBU5438706.1 hypothetical protein [Tissierella simiarum]